MTEQSIQEQQTSTVPDVYLAIERMTSALAEKGIAKDKTAKASGEGNFKFRGIDDLRNATSPLMKHCNLVIIPHVKKRTETERKTKSGGFALHVVLEVDFELVSTKDGSKATAEIQAEAIDYSDKATNKAMSQAYKNLGINVFNIPTVGEEDTDEEKKELQGKKTGVFESPQLRSAYVENCIGAFHGADTALRLKDIEAFYHEKLILLANSEDAEDRAAATRIREAYASRLTELNASQKRTTVESARAK